MQLWSKFGLSVELRIIILQPTREFHIPGVESRILLGPSAPGLPASALEAAGDQHQGEEDAHHRDTHVYHRPKY
jgi:hypothetical protein